jgi:hypothetical protein
MGDSPRWPPPRKKGIHLVAATADIAEAKIAPAMQGIDIAQTDFRTSRTFL